MNWQPDSWRERIAAQMPVYPDEAILRDIESRLAAAAPLVEISDTQLLKRQLADVGAGRAFLLQGGDCAETFAGSGAEEVRRTLNLLLAMAATVRVRGGMDVVKIGRIAGQFAKPRSSPVERIGALSLPAWRGDIVNGAAADPASRAPDPMRMIEAYRQAKATIGLLRASPQGRPAELFTSHEALLLPFEQALTRWDEPSEKWWCRSAHMIWIGDRTRSLDGAHVEFARGVANPVGLKCGPSLGPDELMAVLDRLDPADEPGKIVLIGRFGADRIHACLPRLMSATRRVGRRTIWAIDPMHGNTRTLAGRKTRLLSDIAGEIRAYFAIAAAEGVHPGGIHLELTGSEVTECLGGGACLGETALTSRYRSHCDPRLNPDQALEIAREVADLIAEPAPARSDAA